MSAYKFSASPNIWGDPEDPPYSWSFTRDEVIGDTTYVLIVSSADLDGMPHDEWHDYLEMAWAKHIKDAVS